MALTPVQQASQIIEGEILRVLQPTENSHGMGAAAIGRAIGVYRRHGGAGLNDGVVTGFLNSLLDQKKVQRWPQPNGRGGWRVV
jgi:hypothetical protein